MVSINLEVLAEAQAADMIYILLWYLLIEAVRLYSLRWSGIYIPLWYLLIAMKQIVFLAGKNIFTFHYGIY